MFISQCNKICNLQHLYINYIYIHTYAHIYRIFNSCIICNISRIFVLNMVYSYSRSSIYDIYTVTMMFNLNGKYNNINSTPYTDSLHQHTIYKKYNNKWYIW